MSGGVGEDLKPQLHVIERCKHLQLIHNQNDFVIFSSIFTLNSPQKFDARGYVISEAKATSDYFSSISNLSKARIFLENSSYDSIGSVYFSFRLISDLRLNVQSIRFITSSFHAARVQIIIKNLSKLMQSSLDVKVITPNFEAHIDTTNRIQHEKKQLNATEKLFSKMGNISDFINWMYSDHDNYSNRFKSNTEMKNHLY